MTFSLIRSDKEIFETTRNLCFSAVTPCPEGYRIVFRPKKQSKKPPSCETFLIPKLDKKNDSSAFDFYGLFSKYVEAVNKEICPGPNETLWWCGRVLKDGNTKFVKQNLGIREMRAVPQFLAEKLGKNYFFCEDFPFLIMNR